VIARRNIDLRLKFDGDERFALLVLRSWVHEVGYGKCFRASFNAVVTSDRVAFVLENVTDTW
jgi:hypothetical protein